MGGTLLTLVRRPISLLLAAAALAALSGCVYYNTFYHARAASREAEILRQARPPDTEPGALELELLERAIEKSGRVLRLHPDSEWADDALLLLGTSLYHKGQYESAEARLTEFITRYPDSELRTEAEYALAGVMLEDGNPVSAEELLVDVAYADPPLSLSDDALVMIGEARRARGRHAEAAEAYLVLLERFPGSDLRAETRFLAAENYSEMDRPEEAVVQYAAVANESGGRELLFEARLRLAEARLKIGDPEEALAVLRDLEGRSTGDDDLDQVLLLVGRAQTAAGDLDEAISTYEGIAASRDRSAAAAEAHYRIGLIHRDERRDLEAASSSFEVAKSQAPRSDAAKMAQAARADVDKLRDYLAVIEQQRAEQPEPRVEEPESTADGGDPGLADTLEGVNDNEPLAAHAVADTAGPTAATEPATVDTAGPTAATEPATVDATGATTAGSAAADTVSFDPLAEVAAARFRAAELYLFSLDDATTALRYYQEVITLHSGSTLAPKAALARAWVLANRLDDQEAAEVAYAYVVDNYPGTEYAEAAMAALGWVPLTPEDGVNGEPAEGEGAALQSEDEGGAGETEAERAPVESEDDAGADELEGE